MNPSERITAVLSVLGERDAPGWIELLGCAYPIASTLSKREPPSEMVLRHLELLAEKASAAPVPVAAKPKLADVIEMRPDSQKALDKLTAYLHLNEAEVVEGLLLECGIASRAGLGVSVIGQRIKSARKYGKAAL